MGTLSVIKPVTIDGWRIVLEPMREIDAAELMEITKDERLWRFMARGPLTSIDDAREFVQQALQGQEKKTDLPFVVRLKSSRKMIGSARYLMIEPVHNSVEIGWVFIDPRYHRRYFVQELCYLLIDYAFTKLGAGRVWFKTDDRNIAAKKSMDSMGLRREGVLRKHLRVRDNFIRDSSIHSYIADEWGECGPEFRNRVISAIEHEADTNYIVQKSA